MSDILSIFKIIQNLPISLVLLIITNILLILGFVIGKIVLFKSEDAIKFYAYFSVITCILFALYFLAIILFSISNLFVGNIVYAMIFPIFLLLPFVIGHFATYEKVHFYTNIQILTLIILLS